VSSIRATKRCAAAAAGVGMVLASFAGAAASATASTNHHRPNSVVTSSVGVGVSVGSPVTATTASQATTALALPSTTITDPAGALTNNATVTLTYTGPTGYTLVGSTPSVTPTGTGVSVAFSSITLTAHTLAFTITAPTTTPLSAATYVISGLKVSGTTAPGALTEVVTSTVTNAVPTNLFHVAALSNVAAPAAGTAAPDTAAVLFQSAFQGATAHGTGATGAGIHDLVVATDYAPQDAESANYLAKRLGTGVVLTDPASLSTAVSNIITSYTDIFRIWIVGGTSVVSAADATSLAADVAGRVAVNTSTVNGGASVPQVIRYAGQTQYATNQTIVASVAAGPASTTPVAAAPTVPGVALPFATDASYNSTGGLSSPTTTATTQVTAGHTAIIVSGDIDSYQDGVSSAALSYGDFLPVMLTEPGSLDSGVSTALTAGGYTQAIVMGGPLAVSNAVVTSLIAQGINVLRVAGSDASATSAELAGLETSSIGARSTTGFGYTYTDGTGVLLARGNGFQDALAAGAYAGGNTGSGVGFTPVLLSENATTLGTGLAGYLQTVGGAGFFSVQPIGGALSVTPALSAAAVADEVSGIATP
jgi:putative cell wall-binding protein